MEMHSFKVPSLKLAAKQTCTRTKSLIYLVFPVYIVGIALIQASYAFGIHGHVSNFLAPLTVWWLGLPVFAGVPLIFGVIRKEFMLLMLVALFGADFAGVLTPVQFIVLALIGMLYLPCLSTITILAKEFGWKAASYISLANFATAINCWWNSI